MNRKKLPGQSIEAFLREEELPESAEFYCEYCGEENLRVFVVNRVGGIFCGHSCWAKMYGDEDCEQNPPELAKVVRTKAMPGEPRCWECSSFRTSMCGKHEVVVHDDAVCMEFDMKKEEVKP